jgi:hypothetical protein
MLAQPGARLGTQTRQLFLRHAEQRLDGRGHLPRLLVLVRLLVRFWVRLWVRLLVRLLVRFLVHLGLWVRFLERLGLLA